MRYRRSPRALSRVVGDEVLLASPDHPGLAVLGGTGGAVWRLLDRPRDLVWLTETLSLAYEGSRETIGKDVAALVGDLLDRGWVQKLDG